MKKIWAICGGEDWCDASIDHLILPDGMDIKAEKEKHAREKREYHLAKKNGKKYEWPGNFVKYLMSKGAIAPSEEQLEEYWED